MSELGDDARRRWSRWRVPESDLGNDARLARVASALVEVEETAILILLMLLGRVELVPVAVLALGGYRRT